MHNMVAKNSDEDKRGVEHDRIREFVEKSRRKREESLERARRGEAEVFGRVEELSLQIWGELRRAEQELHSNLEKSRAVMESNITDNAERIDAKIEHSDTKNRSITGRIRELLGGIHGHFEEFKKSIKRVVNEVKKMKLFRQASEDMLFDERQNIRER